MYFCDRKGLKVVQTQRPGIIKATLSRTVFSVASSAPFSSGTAWDVKILTRWTLNFSSCLCSNWMKLWIKKVETRDMGRSTCVKQRSGPIAQSRLSSSTEREPDTTENIGSNWNRLSLWRQGNCKLWWFQSTSFFGVSGFWHDLLKTVIEHLQFDLHAPSTFHRSHSGSPQEADKDRTVKRFNSAGQWYVAPEVNKWKEEVYLQVSSHINWFSACPHLHIQI